MSKQQKAEKQSAGRQWPARVTSGGRIVLPAEIRATLDLPDGAAVTVRLEGRQIVIEPYAEVVKRIQERWQRHIPADRSLVDELIAERRAESARE